jgi:hypothetical protein
MTFRPEDQALVLERWREYGFEQRGLLVPDLSSPDLIR